ncbi:MAG: molybdate ABC transporter substrate-binding protein [Burkholderiales bacterium]
MRAPAQRALAALAMTVLSLAAMGQDADPVQVFAAGSLRAPLTDIAGAFTRATGNKVILTFGASGLLRDRIAGGERADVFASANMEHPAALVQKGWAGAVQPFARNEMCVLAAAGVPVTTDTALATLLDPRWKLGTSTPKADPSGDYAWDVFTRADAVQKGAYATLDAKARKLTGGPQSPPPPADRSVYAMLVANGEADVFLTYCTNARQAERETQGLRSVALPDALRVGATYGVAARRDASPQAAAFVAYLLSPAGQQQLASFGFAPP